MLKLLRRIAKMLPTFSGRVEFHGDDEVPAITVSVEFLIDEDELCYLLANLGAHDALYVTPPAGAVEPRFRGVSEFRLDEKIEGATATLWCGLAQNPVPLGAVTVKDLTLTPQVGGLTQCRCKILASPEIGEHMATLLSAMNHEIELEILDAKLVPKAAEKQSNLNLAGGGGKASGAASLPTPMSAPDIAGDSSAAA